MSTNWGFYFDQSRCLGCKTCTLACKNWNELRRGDKDISKMVIANYMVEENTMEKGDVYINPETGENNYEEYRKFYMKEDWRRVDMFDRGAVSLNQDGTFTSNFERKYLSLSCNHCESPACVDACPVGIISKDEATGAVLVANSSCISCGKCKQACPWSSPQFYDDDYANYPNADPKRPKMTKCTLCYDRIQEGLKPACVAACWNRALDAGPIDELRQKYPQAVESVDEFDRAHTNPRIIFKPKDA